MLTTDPQVAVETLVRGDPCAIPTETVYGLGALAMREAAVMKVYEIKGRPTGHPLIVHIASLAEAYDWIAELPDWAGTLASSIWPGPLTLVGPRTGRALDCVTAGQDTVAVRVPAHPLTLRVLATLSDLGMGGVVAPSANRFGHVSPTTAGHVVDDLGDRLRAHHGMVLDGGPCTLGVESTIVLAMTDRPVVLRPGAVTRRRITEITGLEIGDAKVVPRVSGSLASHYAPHARVVLLTAAALPAVDAERAGLIAFHDVVTPAGMQRIMAPANIAEFAAGLYAGLRQADRLGLDTIYVVEPAEDGLAEAVRDRLRRAANPSA